MILVLRTLRILSAASIWIPAVNALQIVNPADKQHAEEVLVPPSQETPDTYRVGTTVVTARRVSPLDEEQRIGPYDQPAWTAARRFPSTRIYVRPPGSFGFEYWSRPTIPRHGPAEIQTQYEFELGLPGRVQVDMYIVRDQAGDGDESSSFDEQKFEVRYALADWGKLWANPTLYVELANKDDAPDAIEFKLLLGDELKPGWHWGTNFVFERELGGDLENNYELTAGISHTLEDERFSLGGELKTSIADVHEDRGDFEEQLLIGPSLQYRPTPQIHVDFAPLVGVGHDSPELQAFFVLGYDF